MQDNWELDKESGCLIKYGDPDNRHCCIASGCIAGKHILDRFDPFHARDANNVMQHALDSAWQAMYPDTAWSYPAQVALHVRSVVAELKAVKENRK